MPEQSPLKVSFEFFPPKSEKMQTQLWNAVERLAPLNPDFVSVTYGAGGSTRERTHDTVRRIINNTKLHTAAHLTCVEATRDQVNSVLEDYWAAGVRHIVALRGDPPDGVGGTFVQTENGYLNAADLAKGARDLHAFEVTVGCYPEKHPESPDFQLDIELLKQKVDAGATRAITQFFYDNDVYFRFLEKVRAAGINIPVVPGIMPVLNFTSLQKMARMCGTTIPAKLLRMFENLDDDPDTRQMVAATIAAEQCLDLADQGISHFHFYTLNRAEMSFALCHMLGVRPNPGSQEAAA
ncbi:methylenetetrahydrofolate reductase [NAD(P)H] [Parvularcula sp. IMCC14364]|uniref:methylenetetrahydrofolate reductase [NAD(P)H] n=1 Tax=Parvularcula sp. IMCC14364 TaxID=3067902 RepID=UPI00274249F2|nr:methylenetetrahydrofolate reductase [NAD(P)H] [Parvularcula sp. IMCC14364]